MHLAHPPSVIDSSPGIQTYMKSCVGGESRTHTSRFIQAFIPDECHIYEASATHTNVIEKLAELQIHTESNLVLFQDSGRVIHRTWALLKNREHDAPGRDRCTIQINVHTDKSCMFDKKAPFLFLVFQRVYLQFFFVFLKNTFFFIFSAKS